MSRLESIDRRIRFVHVAFALVLVVLSALALRLWALPKMTELASDKAYFASLNIPPLFDARKQGYSFDDAKRHLQGLGPAGGTITPACTFQATIWRSLLRCLSSEPCSASG